MLNKITAKLTAHLETAEAHCDAPCGIYDPASARIAAEAALSMTKKILDLKAPDGGDAKAAAVQAGLQKQLTTWMRSINDPLLRRLAQ